MIKKMTSQTRISLSCLDMMFASNEATNVVRYVLLRSDRQAKVTLSQVDVHDFIKDNLDVEFESE